MQGIVAILASLLIRVLSFTWRVRLLGPDPEQVPGPRIFCFWHGDQAGLFGHPRRHQLVVMSSLSRDGALQAQILARLGLTVVRGSSSRGGAGGLKGIVREIKNGKDALFAVDGPRGPYHEVKPGAVTAAKMSDANLIPVQVKASRSWVFSRAWDQYTLPKPFTKVEVHWGEPIDAAVLDSDEVIALLSTRLSA